MNRPIHEHVSREELLRWTIDLVSTPSYSGLPNQEAGVGAYIKGVFDREGIECRIVPLRDGRCNVYARLPGAGGGRSLMLNGHMDTVPAYGMDHAFEPWLDDEGRLHGRGTSDMKGPLAAMMGALVAIKRSGVKLCGDLLYCAVADEEEGSLGTIALVEEGLRADAAIVGEPTGTGRIAITQKGLEWFQFDFTGRTVHGGAYREGVNAIFKAVKFIGALQTRLVPELEKRVLPLVGESTLNVGVIRGGTQLSTVAGECSVQLDRRFVPGLETYESCVAELRALADSLAAQDPDFKYEMKVLESSVMEKGYVHQGFAQSPDDPFVLAVKRGVEKALGIDARLVGCPCWTDAGLLAHYGNMPVVIYGPGEMACAHSKEECIALDELEEAMRAYVAIEEGFCG
ncbi:MAG TPA: M20 family metallopeptidase [Clostridia bacterium]|nr:M20 family metallopeptidase [Clostridia bacterium]